MNRNESAMKAAYLLLEESDVKRALGGDVVLHLSREHAAVRAIGNVVAQAAVDAAFRSFAGHALLEGAPRPIAVGEMVLMFDNAEKALKTFSVVAEAAHLRTRLGGSSVAVETITTPAGLVSYWGFVHYWRVIAVLTLDTVDPNEVSMTNFRSLVTRSAERVEAGGTLD